MRCERPLTQSETKAEINQRTRLYEGNSLFLEELCSLPLAWRASEALHDIKEGRSIFGSLGSMVANAGEFVAGVCAKPVMMATSVVTAASPSTVNYVDATAAVLLESVENTLPVVRSDPVKGVRRLKYKSMTTFYEGAKSVVRSHVGQFTLRTVNTVVEGTEALLAYVGAPEAGWIDAPRGEEDGEESPAEEVRQGREDMGLVCWMMTLPLKAGLMITKPIQRTMVYFGKNRRLRSKSAPTPRRDVRGARKSLDGRRKVSPKKRVPKDREQPPFYYRIGHALLVTLNLASPAQPKVPRFLPPVHPNGVEEDHEDRKRKYDEMESEDSGDGTLSDIMGDLEGYRSDEDPSFEWDDGMGGYSDSFEYMTDSFSELEDELDFVEQEADTNIIGGRPKSERKQTKKEKPRPSRKSISKPAVTVETLPSTTTNSGGEKTTVDHTDDFVTIPSPDKVVTSIDKKVAPKTVTPDKTVKEAKKMSPVNGGVQDSKNA